MTFLHPVGLSGLWRCRMKHEHWYPAVRAAAHLMVWLAYPETRSELTWDAFESAVTLLHELLEVAYDELKPIAEAEARRRAT